MRALVFLGFLMALCESQGVVQLQAVGFKDAIADGLWLVEFYAPWCGHCKQLKPIYEKAAIALKGKLKLAAVDAIENKELMEEYGVNGFPTIMLFKDGEYRQTYDGERTVAAFQTYANQVQTMGEKSPSDVLSLTTTTFDDAVEKGTTVVFFYAPWCGHCKRFHHSWEEIATELKPMGIKAAKVDATAHEELRKQFQIGSFPKLLAFKNGRLRGEHIGDKSKLKGVVDWGLSMIGPTVHEFDGDLTRLNPDVVSFVLSPDGQADSLSLFSKTAERHAVDGKVEFFVDTSEELQTARVIAVCMNKTFDMENGLGTSELERFVKDNKKPWFRILVPGENFNEVMYDGDNLAATAHVNMTMAGSLQYLEDFKQLAWEMRASKINFAALDANLFLKMSTQVGIFKQHLPQVVVFNGKTLNYYSDRQLPRTKEAIKHFIAQVQFGTIPPKKPNSEKENETPEPPIVNSASETDAIPSKLYGQYSEARTSSTRSVEDRVTRTEEILEQLLIQQKSIGASIIRLHEELFDLRTDIEPLTGMRFVRVEAKDRMQKEYEKLTKSNNITSDDDAKAQMLFLKQLENFDPYRLGILTLNNESSYNKWKGKFELQTDGAVTEKDVKAEMKRVKALG